MTYLTQREWEAIEAYLKHGKQSAAAAALGVSLQTLKNHLGSAYAKAKVQSFAQMVHLLHKEGRL